MQIGLETSTHEDPLQATSSCSTMGPLHGEANVNLRSHYPPWKLSIWHLRRPPRSWFGCEDFSRNWAMEAMIPLTCLPTTRVRLHYPRIRFLMPGRNTLTYVTISFAMQFRTMWCGYSIFLPKI